MHPGFLKMRGNTVLLKHSVGSQYSDKGITVEWKIHK